MDKLRQTLLKENGATIVEILISIFVLSVGITGSLAYFTTAQAATRVSLQKTTATAHAEYILEEMSALPTSVAITRSDDPDQTYQQYWDAFIANQALTSPDLINENITVNIAGIVDGQPDPDPLQITVTVSWDVGSSETRDISLYTELTK